MAEQWFTCKDLAEQWRLSTYTVHRYATKGHPSGIKLEGVKLGGWRFRASAVQAFEDAVITRIEPAS